MKKLMLVAALTLVPVAGFAQSAFDNGEQPTFAQADGKRGDRMGKRGKRGDRMGKRGKRGKRGLRIMLKSLKEVGVSDATLEKIKTELKSQKPAVKKLREEAKAARKTGDPILMQEAQLKLAEKRLEMTSDVRKYVTKKQWNDAIQLVKQKRKERMQKRMQRMQAEMDEL